MKTARFLTTLTTFAALAVVNLPAADAYPFKDGYSITDEGFGERDVHP